MLLKKSSKPFLSTEEIKKKVEFLCNFSAWLKNLKAEFERPGHKERL